MAYHWEPQHIAGLTTEVQLMFYEAITRQSDNVTFSTEAEYQKWRRAQSDKT